MENMDEKDYLWAYTKIGEEDNNTPQNLDNDKGA